MTPLSGLVQVTLVPMPRRRVTIDPHSDVSPSYWYVDGRAVPRTELGRQYLEAAYREDVAAGWGMSYESLCGSAPPVSLCGAALPVEES